MPLLGTMVMLSNLLAKPTSVNNVFSASRSTASAACSATCAFCSAVIDANGMERTTVAADAPFVLPLPLGSSAIQSFHSVIFQPIFLNQNASQLVGFAAGGFDWVEQVTQLFSMRTPGVMIVVVNGPAVVTFRTTNSALAFLGFGDSHDSKYDRYVHTEYLFPTATGGDDSAAYKVYIYPTDEFFADSETFTPLITAIASGLLIGLFAVVFLMYDMMVRRESAARATVLETKRRFVRFISHEVRSPLNAVHLGLEALTAEVTKMLEYLSKGCSNDTMTVQETLRSWLELSSEMMGNSESAVDVLNDLLNYDKIEMGTLRLDFAAVAVWPLVEKCTRTFSMQARQKDIVLDQACTFGTQEGEGACGEYTQSLVVIGDSGRLAQVMRNLLSNAIKFTSASGTITVTGQWCVNFGAAVIIFLWFNFNSERVNLFTSFS